MTFAADARQWENISYCLAQLSFTDKGIKKLIELFKTYEHVLSNEVVMEHFRSIISKVASVTCVFPLYSKFYSSNDLHFVLLHHTLGEEVCQTRT